MRCSIRTALFIGLALAFAGCDAEESDEFLSTTEAGGTSVEGEESSSDEGAESSNGEVATDEGGGESVALEEGGGEAAVGEAEGGTEGILEEEGGEASAGEGEGIEEGGGEESQVVDGIPAPGALCPIPEPWGYVVGDNLKNMAFTNCQGESVTMYDSACGAAVSWVYFTYGW